MMDGAVNIASTAGDMKNIDVVHEYDPVLVPINVDAESDAHVNAPNENNHPGNLSTFN